ncbi:MAG TPA: hypothetical protein VFI96_03310 [Longimicrobiaceae bacterium]|nr:hypothetical protein [Longimicrobiaceae bacterium]
MRTAQLSIWTPVLTIAAVLFAIFLVAGYGLIGLFLLVVLLAMGGGWLLYGLDGESDE